LSEFAGRIDLTKTKIRRYSFRLVKPPRRLNVAASKGDQARCFSINMRFIVFFALAVVSLLFEMASRRGKAAKPAATPERRQEKQQNPNA
jgi:hypothetical protein